MLGCAIADGLFASQTTFFRVQFVARQWSLARANLTGGSTLVRSQVVKQSPRRFGILFRPKSSGTVRMPFPTSFYSAPIQIRGAHTRPYDIETNLPKDVILFKYDNPKYFKRLNIFAISQLLLWTYIAQFVYTELRDAPVVEVSKEDQQWWQRVNFGEASNRKILTFIVWFVGCSLFCLSWMYILKSVRYLVLRKGGREITLVTYAPFGENRMRTVTLDKVTSKQSREKATVHIPIKVKGDWMHYLLDIKGEFKNPQLFDFTAGLKRQI
ncbi:transmembrane protein 223 [Athalia rosae]|uniref:transmembrane protein 223 n=1 Tax=Athalia rosae TaxID=37344 RepID=UPI002033BAB3|nr:transmembrane protein 223 [Athalia rosae]